MNEFQQHFRKTYGAGAAVINKIERAVEIAKQIDNEDLTNFEEFVELINYLQDYGVSDPTKLIENWHQ